MADIVFFPHKKADNGHSAELWAALAAIQTLDKTAYTLAPQEPTALMIAAAHKIAPLPAEQLRAVYRAMLDAW